MTPRSHIDHLAITSPNLKAGVELVRAVLGVTPQMGGAHPRMGTHNVLLKLGEALFLEVISPDPNAPKPDRARWFELDGVRVPRLTNWVARTTDIRASLGAASEALGKAELMTRGSLSWMISIPADGSLPLGGAAPALIEWHAGAHPASGLQDAGCALRLFQLFHPQPERVSALLKSIALADEVEVRPLAAGERPYLAAHIETPAGVKILKG
jgi:hypothetical protein